jgi:hypothetical protein
VGGVGGDQVEHLTGPGRRITAATLQHHPDAFPDPAVLGGRIQTQDLDAARVRPQESLTHLHRGGLARAVGAQQGQHLGAVDVEVQLGDRGGGPVALGHAAQAHRGGGRSGGHGDSA